MKHIKRFEKWFNKRYAWFFTNGHKYQDNPNMYKDQDYKIFQRIFILLKK